jgi:hypothetical protein
MRTNTYHENTTRLRLLLVNYGGQEGRNPEIEEVMIRPGWSGYSSLAEKDVSFRVFVMNRSFSCIF